MYWRELLKTELVTVCCFVAGALVFGMLFGGGIALPPQSKGKDAAVMFAGFFVMFGSVPAVILFAPIYAWLRHRGKATAWRAVACGGVASGVVAVVMPPLALFAIPAGCVVALAVHQFLKGWPQVAIPMGVVSTVIIALWVAWAMHWL